MDLIETAEPLKTSLPCNIREL